MNEEIVNIFRMLHDGIIIGWNGNKIELELIIECLYLAELENEEHTSFRIFLKNITSLDFYFWDQDDILNDIKEIVELDLEIVNAQLENDLIKLICNIGIGAKDSIGGELWMKVGSYSLKTEDGDIMDIEKLQNLSSSYWEGR